MNITIEKDLVVPMRDGIGLATDVYRSADGSALPAILLRMPYGKERAALIESTFETLVGVQRGFAVVIQDVRGTGASEGVFEPLVNEADDGTDTLAWLADQPWCTGQIGMAGASYFGMTQWLAAAAAPGAVKAIAPIVSSPEIQNGFATWGGAFQLGAVLLWFVQHMVPDELLREIGSGDRDPAALTAQLAAIDGLDELYERLPLNEAPEASIAAGTYLEWLGHPDADDYWRALEPADLSAVQAPALIVGGWYDIFLRGTLNGYRAMAKAAGGDERRRPRLIVGPWAHGNSFGGFPQRNFGVMAGYAAADVVGAQLDWFDRHLKGAEPDPEETPVRIFVMGPNIWRDETDWPLPDTRFAEYHLHSGGSANTAHGNGSLSLEPPADEEYPDAYLYDPRDPVPTVGGAPLLPGLFVSANSGPMDQAEVEGRHDVLCYTSESLARDLEVTGPVELILFVSSSARDTDFTGKLVDVSPGGRAELVTDGILRARYRESLERQVLLEPEEVYELRIDMGATARVFPAGHRLRLEVSSSNFPRFDRNTNSGGVIAADGPDDLVVALNRVFHEPDRASRLVLPLIDG